MREFLDDTPISSINADELGRENLTLLIAESIRMRCSRSHSSVSLGIYGSWGEGKTSLMKMVQSLLSGNDAIKTVWFNAWEIADKDSMETGFFSAFAEAAVDSPELYAAISSFVYAYSSPRGEGVGPQESYYRKLQRFINVPGGSVSEIKTLISRKLKESERHIVVFVDDIDRLLPEEILSIFKLIRQVADFDNVVYVLGIDPAVVSTALASSYGGDTFIGSNYLKKIVQVPIVLPEVQENRLNALIEKNLRALVEDCGATVKEEDMKNVSLILPRLLGTKREIVRFVNQLSLVYPSIWDETEFVDLCLLEALKCVDEQGWRAIYAHRTELVETEPDKDEGLVPKVIDERYEAALAVVRYYYPERLHSCVIDLLTTLLFPKKTPQPSYYVPMDEDEFYVERKRVSDPTYFPYYFIGLVPDGVIPEREIKNYADCALSGEKEAREWINSKAAYGEDEIARASIKALEFAESGTKGQFAVYAVINLCRALSFAALVSDQGTERAVERIARVVAKNIISYSIGKSENLREKIVPILKRIFSEAKLDYAMSLFNHVTEFVEFSDDEKQMLLETVSHRLVEADALASVPSGIIWPFWKNWRRTDKDGFNAYMKEVLLREDFDFGRMIVKRLEPFLPGTDTEEILAMDEMFRDVKEELLANIKHSESRDNEPLKAFISSSSLFPRTYTRDE